MIQFEWILHRLHFFSDDFGTSFKSIYVYFEKWLGSNFWGTPTELQNYFNDLVIYLITLNSYYDENDTTFFSYAKYLFNNK